MEKMIRNKFWRKVRAMVVAAGAVMMVAGNCWGADYTIQTQSDKEFPQKDVPTMTDTIYVKKGESRKLFIKEMEAQSGNTDIGLALSYDWYVRWYRMAGNNVTAINNVFSDGSSESALKEANNGSDGTTSLFWFHRFIDTDSPSKRSQAATVYYVGTGSEDVVVCDVSANLDGLGYHLNSATATTITEPTIGRRYQYIIKDATEIATRLNAVATNVPFQTYNITVPAGATAVNLQMDMTANNYYWGTDATNQGDHFSYSIGGTTNTIASDVRVFNIGNVTSNTIVDVSAVTSTGATKLITRFNLTVQSDAGYKIESKISADDEYRNPQNYPAKFGLIGSQDFDFNQAQPNLEASNNMPTTQLDPGMTAYAFNNPNLSAIHPFLTCLQNMYGIYRSANVEGVSKNDTVYGWGKGRSNSPASIIGERAEVDRTYNWYYASSNQSGDTLKAQPVYDRTYTNEKQTKYGYFCYVDASQLPGRIVSVPINGRLCGGTELTVTAWVANMTSYVTQTRPNLNFLLKGTKDGTEVILHRFTTGNMMSETEDDQNTVLACWYQVKYTVTLASDASDYDSYSVEVQNNTLDSNGADYAIDDIRIYKTLPDIEVHRRNECEASTLIVSTSYDAILTNMGWRRGDLVATDKEFDFNDPENLEYRKYRYGLMGEAGTEFLNSTVGNVYFAFYDAVNKKWQTVNEAVSEYSENAAMSLRVAVSTVQSKNADGGTNGWEFYTNDETEALKFEQNMNLRAVRDYNNDIADWQKEDPIKHPNKIDISKVGIPGEDNFNEDEYQKAIIELFGKRLDIPRLRCPWYDEDPTDPNLYLGILDVNNTSLKYRGQIDENGNVATGVYQVVTFSAEAVADAANAGGEYEIDPESACTLMSPFTVDPATTVLIDAVSPGDPDIAVCMGTVHEIVAYLNFYDKDTQAPIPAKDTKDLEYIFDWYLGSLTEYDGLTTTNGFSVKEALNAYRTAEKNSLYPIEKSDLQTWTDAATDGSEEKKMGTLLLDLMDNGKLLLGTLANEPFDMPINTERMVAMPYLPKVKVEGKNYDFCSAETEVNLQAVSPDNPEIFQGFVKVEYKDYTDVALRLGQPNMDGTTLKLPIHKVSNMASNATRLGLALNSIDITLIDESGTPHTVGTATSLNIPKTEGELKTQATLTFSLNATAKEQMQEGSSYTLLIPFVQFKGTEQLNSECDGTLELPVKVVPEYLTWKGAADDDWYDDKKWNQSREKELHINKVGDTDANGSDDVTKAFSPLYFTNITILGTDTLDAENRELQLDNTIVKDESQEGTLSIDDNIKYDLAVAKSDGTITPYYIYNVEEVYFKPGATLLNQHLLTYTKAHVEFTMKEGEDYWMASPLQDVYAGDMYAPTKGGKQRTPVFGEDGKITYNEQLNDRWNPAFYQKAWNKTVWYMDKNNAKVKAPLVESNWNIEYNDVWVPYTIGNGFYSRVEERDALVRLPKDDTSYGYETKALSKPGTRLNAGKLADLTDGSMTLDLTKVDNDGNHFLVGNPYMAYLDMNAFLTENSSVLAKKYWTIDEGTVRVGTPDVAWGEGANSGYVAPMQAFFVEHKDYKPDAETTKADETATTLEVTFNAGMTVSATEVTTSADTKSFSAVNPILTLTATSKQGQSRAAVVQKSDASNQYEADKDAVALLDSELDAPMAYTVAGSYAAAVNAIHDYKNVPLGVYAKDGEEVELSIEGASQLVSPLYLYDAVTRSTTPIEGDSYTLSLTGSSHGRYFLTTDEGVQVESDIRIYSPFDGQIIIASTPSDRLKQIQVYDMSGRLVESRENVEASTYQLYVPGGIYIVRVQSEQGEAQAKLKIK